MPLWLLAIAVPLGIALIVWLVKKLDGDVAPIFANELRARSFVKAEIPQSVVTAIQTGEGGRAIAFKMKDGQVGLVRQIGRNHVLRIVAPVAVFIKGNGSIRFVDVNDPAFPPIKLTFSSSLEAEEFARALKT